MKKKQKYSHFCFCLGLRPGVIISSVLWMIEGIAFSKLFITFLIKNKKDKDDVGEEITSVYYHIGTLSIILSTYFIILSLISIFGLVSLLIYKSTRLLRTYSYISWFFAVFIHTVLAIVSAIAMIVSRGDYCNKIGNPGDCSNYVVPQFIVLFLILFFQGSLHIYFSIILRTYVKRCEQVEKKKKRKVTSSKRLDLLNSSSNKNNVFNIKVDKTFDDRVVDI